MKVSYIVTVYNKASYLPFVIDGLFRQEGEFDKEYIFVDDGSTETTQCEGQSRSAGPGRGEGREVLG